mmetsp:Transcript_2466/g.4790  ORF Transcript_2466/g.4790 Transcript_2466/m.4790 type:complete len:317 (-) Transcript_2466:111-1061(-)
MAASSSVNVMNTQQQQQQRQRDPESFWSLVLKRNSSNKLSKLLTAWVQESLKPTEEQDVTLEESESPKQMDLLAQTNGATHTAMPNVNSAKCDSGFAEYAYHMEDAEGTPRKDSPDDVIATADAMQGRRPTPSTHAPLPPPNPPPHAEPLSEMTSPELNVDETPSTAVVFEGEREFHDPQADSRAVARVANENRTARTLPAPQMPPTPGHMRHPRPSPHSLSPPTAPTATSAGSSRAAEELEVPRVRNVNSCSECQADFTGPSFMLNDRAYCCQRHRLLAYHKFERGQIDHPGFQNTDDPQSLLASGVRASFRAWI